MEQQFETHSPITLYVELGKGTLSVTATDTTETTVTATGKDADELFVEQEGNQINVIAPRQRVGFFGGGEPAIDVDVVVPNGSDLVTKTGSADVAASGTFGHAKVKSGSGDVSLDRHFGHVLVDTGSGDISVVEVSNDLRVKSGSGDVSVGSVVGSMVISTGSGDVTVASTQEAAMVKSGSGDLRIDAAQADVNLSSASGDLTVGRFERGAVTAKNASGDIKIGIPGGIPVWTDISSVTGRIGSDLEGAGQPEKGQDYVEVRAKTVSGDIVLKQL